LARQRTRVFDRLLADPPPARLLCGVIGLRSLAAEYPPRPELLLEFWIGRVVEVLRLFLGIEVIEVAEELIEAVDRGQIFVQIAEVVLSVLSRRVAERLQRLGNSDIAVL